MARRKKVQEIGFIRPATGLVGGALILGAGGTAVSTIGGPTAGAASGGLVAAASFFPVIGVGVGAGITLQQLRKLERPTKRKR